MWIGFLCVKWMDAAAATGYCTIVSTTRERRSRVEWFKLKKEFNEAKQTNNSIFPRPLLQNNKLLSAAELES